MRNIGKPPLNDVRPYNLYDIDEPSYDFTADEIENIWKRVLASIEDPPGTIDFLLMGGEAVADGAQENTEGSCGQEEYNVYSDINRSMYGYGKTDEPAEKESEPDGNLITGNISPQIHNRPYEYLIIEQPETEDQISFPEPVKKDDDPDLDKLVRELVEEQLFQSRFLRGMTRGAPNRRSARALSFAANKNYSTAKSLASAYFIHSGIYHFPNGDRSADGTPLYRAALRAAWKNELSLTARCAGAAEMTEYVPLMKALLAGARSHAGNAVDIRRMINQSAETQPAETPRDGRY